MRIRQESSQNTWKLVDSCSRSGRVEKLARWPTSSRERIKRPENVWTWSRENSTFEFFLSLFPPSPSPGQIGQPVYARVSCRKTLQSWADRDDSTKSRKKNFCYHWRPRLTNFRRTKKPANRYAAPPKGLENFARIYCRSSFEKLGNRNAWKINARHFSLLN